MRKKEAGPTYLQPRHQSFWRIPVNYTDKEKQKIGEYFPPKDRDAALKEISDTVSTLLSLLNSSNAIKRAESLRAVEALKRKISPVRACLQVFFAASKHPHTIQLKKSFREYQKELYESIRVHKKRDAKECRFEIGSLQKHVPFEDFCYLVEYIERSCDELLTNPGRPAMMNQAAFNAVSELAKMWERRNGKRPTISNYYGLKGRSDFVDFMEIAINGFIDRYNLEGIKKQKEVLSLYTDKQKKAIRSSKEAKSFVKIPAVKSLTRTLRFVNEHNTSLNSSTMASK